MTREINELALNCGKQLLSPQTGFIHHFYHSQDTDPQQTIPVYENVLYALALLQSRTVENMTEGMHLLEKLLAFQNLEIGQFPIYLHDYPNCKDPYLGIRLLAPFYWIHKHFGHVLGIPLKQKLEASILLLLQFSQTTPYSITLREAAAQQAFGTVFQDKDLLQKGKNKLDELCEMGEVDSWHSTDYLADMLIGLQMIYPSLLNSPWKHLWKYLNQTWHHKIHAYIGPIVREEQAKEEPAPRLYDIFMGTLMGVFPPRILQPKQIIHLQAALIQPFGDLLEPAIEHSLEGMHRNNQWHIDSFPDWACTILNKDSLIDPTHNRTYTPFRLIWGDLARVHTLCCQGGDILVNHNKNSTYELAITLPEGVDLENRERQREVNFFLDLHPEAVIKVNGESANTFEAGQELTIQSGNMRVSIQFTILEGKGQFLGHLMRGNRPSQICAKGQHRFNAYDWQFVWRTIRRQGVVKLGVKINIHST